MTELIQQPKKHTSINKSIRRLNLSKDSVQSLVSEIGGSARPPKDNTEEKQPEVSLKETLETAPER